MKKIRISLLVLVTFAFVSAIHAQTADEIINKHINAIGGRDVLSKIKSVYLEGAATAMGTDYPTTTTILAGKGFKSVTTVNGSDIIQCFTDTSAWSFNPLMGQANATALPADMVKRGRSSLVIGGALLDYKTEGYTDSLIGRENINGANTYKIKLSQPGISIIYYIDPSTYYIVKTDTQSSMDGKDETNTTTYSNYKKTDAGFTVPYTIGVTNMGYDVSINYTKVVINKDVDPTIFMMPK